MAGKIIPIIGAAVAFGATTTAIYLQNAEQLIPCSLCVWQRLLFAIISGSFLITALLANTNWQQRVNVFTMALSGGGLLVAGLHIWLQSNPHINASCGPSLEYLLENFSFFTAIKKFIASPGHCAEVSYTLGHLSLAEWAFITFLLCALLSLLLLGWQKKSPHLS